MIEAPIHTADSIRELLSTINDPEVPAVNIIELGIIRNVELFADRILITVTPTYSGCPAMKMIEDEIKNVLSTNGVSVVDIKTVYSPAWTTDWMNETTKMKLKKYGIAPPMHLIRSPLLQIELPVIPCPHCNSNDTQMKSEFGSTACKSYLFCNSCRQPFEYFKSF